MSKEIPEPTYKDAAVGNWYVSGELPFFGYNFLGPGTQYRARMKGDEYYREYMRMRGQPAEVTPPYNKPINKLDEAAMHHEAAYDREDATSDEMLEADKKFMKEVEKIGTDDGYGQFNLAQVCLLYTSDAADE